MTHTTWTVVPARGTVNSSTPVTATSGADSNSQGRALPPLMRVRSMICPIMRFVTASIALLMMGNRARNDPPHTPVRFSTSV